MYLCASVPVCSSVGWLISLEAGEVGGVTGRTDDATAVKVQCSYVQMVHT